MHAMAERPIGGRYFGHPQRKCFATLVLALTLSLAASSARPAAAQGVVDQKAKFEAAYLVLFTKYISWPESAFNGPKDAFVFGVLGTHEVERHLRVVEKSGRPIANRKMAVKRFDRPEQIGKCHILFVPSSAGATAEKQVAKKLDGTPTLLVGESDTILKQGGTARFSLVENKLKIIMMISAVSKTGLQGISKLSRVVEFR